MKNATGYPTPCGWGGRRRFNIGLIGTGNFAHKVHFPVLTERDKVPL